METPPKAAFPPPVAALRTFDDEPHRHAARAYPRGEGRRSNGSLLSETALACCCVGYRIHDFGHFGDEFVNAGCIMACG